MNVPPEELKVKIIQTLNLEEVTPEHIANDAPLFGAGGLVITDMEKGRPAFKSVNTLTAFVNANRPA